MGTFHELFFLPLGFKNLLKLNSAVFPTEFKRIKKPIDCNASGYNNSEFFKDSFRISTEIPSEFCWKKQLNPA